MYDFMNQLFQQAIMLSTDMAKKMKGMNKKLKKICELHSNYGTGSISQTNVTEVEETTSIGSDVIVGRTFEKQRVINILLNSSNKASATNIDTQAISNCIVVHGLAGVGKTELAKLVFKDQRIQDAFPQRAWVYLRQNMDIKDIGRAIISSVEASACNLEILESIYEQLRKVLNSRCLIVLDNLWNPFHLAKLLGILDSNVSILVTSRRAIDQLDTRKAILLFPLDPLSDKFSFDLVKYVASRYFPEGDIPKIAMKEIVEKCRGVPLALKSVASQLKPERSVKEMLSIIKASFQPRADYGPIDIEQTVFDSLKLTYQLMTKNLRLFFAYCAIFTKGCEIDREDLYHQWIALDLVEEPLDKSPITKRMSAERNVGQLLDMSFLQHSGPSSVTKRSPVKLKMHDLVHDLAILVVDDDLVVINPENTKCIVERPRYAVVFACEKENSYKNLPAGLKTLHIKNCPRLKFKWHNYSFVKLLRILDISGCCTDKLPSSIGNLMRLRYLNASGIQCKELPKTIGSLSELQYLNLHGSSILALPDSATKLGQLMHLDISECTDLQMLPKSFCELESLCFLSLKNCSQLCSLPDDLDRLENLGNLNLSGCSCIRTLPESLGDLASLKQLDLSSCSKLTMLPNSFVRLIDLRYLNISSCSELDIPVDSLNKLVNLNYLDMSSCPTLLGLPEEFCSLKHLHTLNLSDCSKLSELPERLGQMQSIRFILLDDCAELVRKPILQHRLGAGLQSLPAFVVEVPVDSIRSNISQLQQEKFSELELYRLEKVRTVDEAESLKMPSRSGLRSLGLMWTLNIDRFVKDEVLLQALEPPEDLQKFRVQGYMAERFPKWNVELGSGSRRQLQEIGLMHFPMCNSLPQLGQLTNLRKLHLSQMPKIRKLGGELCDDTGVLRNLESFTLEYMENLEQWCTTMASANGQHKQEGFMFPSLQELNIYHCPRLTMQPCPPRSIKWEVRASSGAAQLLLQKDGVMQSLADYMGLPCPFVYTTELHVRGSSSISPCPPSDGWKFNSSLITLKDLTNDCCTSIDTLLGKGNSMECFLNLEISGIEGTNGLQEQVETVTYYTRPNLAESWPHWFSKKPSVNNGASPHFMVTGYASCVVDGWIDKVTSFLGNLIRINMDELPMCDRLPPLGQLPKLQELRLKGMPKITRIDWDFCGNDHSSSSALFFTRLTTLTLSRMPNLVEWITKVQEGSDHYCQEFMFPVLVKLTIWNCPNLKLKPCPPRALEWDINNSDHVIASTHDINSGGELASVLQVLLCKVPPNNWKLLHNLSGIQNLEIISCHGMESVPESIRRLSSLRSLTLSKCHGLKHLPEWLGELTSLEKLMVVSSPMEFLPGSLRRLPSFRSLSLSFCDRMTLPGWLGDLKSLKKLSIQGCKNLRSLPQLYNLQDLVIEQNDELERWCESDVNRSKFAHIKQKGFWPLESPRWSNNYIIPAISLHITWADDDRYWRSHSIPDCRFAESMELIEVWWLWIMGTVPAGALCANTSYDVYLVYKLADEHDGLRWGDSFIQIDDKDHSRALVSFIDEDAVRVDGVAYPVRRSEGWMELWLGEFDSKHGQSEVKVGVTETTNTYAKKGLIIEGMEIRVR